MGVMVFNTTFNDISVSRNENFVKLDILLGTNVIVK